MTEQPRTRKYGPVIAVRIDPDGVPRHPETGTRMVEVEPGVWGDPIAVEMQRQAAEAVCRMVDRQVRDVDEPPVGTGKLINTQMVTGQEEGDGGTG